MLQQQVYTIITWNCYPHCQHAAATGVHYYYLELLPPLSTCCSNRCTLLLPGTVTPIVNMLPQQVYTIITWNCYPHCQHAAATGVHYYYMELSPPLSTCCRNRCTLLLPGTVTPIVNMLQQQVYTIITWNCYPHCQHAAATGVHYYYLELLPPLSTCCRNRCTLLLHGTVTPIVNMLPQQVYTIITWNCYPHCQHAAATGVHYYYLELLPPLSTCCSRTESVVWH